VLAAFLVYLGDQIGVGSDLSLAVVVVFGMRIFSNLAAIRWHLFGA
jgi:small basic protein